MRLNGRIPREIKGLTKNRRKLEKDKTGRNMAILDQMFPQCFPAILAGETKIRIRALNLLWVTT